MNVLDNVTVPTGDRKTHYRELVRGLPAAMYCTDTSGLLTMYNDAAAALWGRRPALGLEAWCGSYRIFRGDGTELPLSECPMARLVKTRQPMPPQEIIIERPDGTRRQVLAHPQLMVDAEGTMQGACNMLVDITEQKQAEMAQARLATIVTSSDDAILSKDLNGRILSWNASAERLFGYSPDEVIGQPITLLIPSDRQNDEFYIFDRITRGERVHHYETVRRRRDGRLVDVSMTVSPLLDATGTVVGASTIARDITEQKVRRRQQHQLYELATAVNLAEALPDLYDKALGAIRLSLKADRAAILLFEADGVMRFKAWHGLSDPYRRAVEGHSPWDKNDPSPSPLVVGNIADWGIEDHLKDVLTRERIGALAFIPLTYGGRLLGKFMVYFDRPYAMNGDEVDLAQAIARTLALGIERKTAEDRLRERESQLRLALEAGRMGSWEWMIPTNTVIWSPGLEAIHGLEPGTFDGTFDGFQRDIHPEDRDQVLRSITQTLEHNDQHYIEYRIVLPDGTLNWVEGKGRLFRDQTGKPTRMLGVCTNITERKQAEQALRESEDKLRKLASRLEQLVTERTARLRALATELNLTEQRERQRLATELHDHLQQLLVLAKLKLGQGKRLAAPVEDCVEVIKQADDVLSQALTYTRTLVTELSPPVLKQFGLSAAIQWLGQQMGQHQLTVQVEALNDELELPEEHAVLLFQSVRELLINSAKYAGTGRASVRMQRESGALRIEVRDEGTGFDLASAGQQDPTASSSTFGLFSIRERMSALGGTFDLASAPDRGTRATLTLPLLRDVGTGPAAAWPSPAAVGADATGMTGIAREPERHRQNIIRVLLVDDHAMMRQGLRSVLEAYDDVLIVGEAADGEEAVASVHRDQPSIVVMDINMPRLNGIDATVRIKAAYPDIRVIGLSVNADAHNQDAMTQAGADLLLTKEAVVDELYRAILQTLSRA